MLEGERLSLRPVADADIARLQEILGEPSVARRWPADALDKWAASDDTARLAICVDDQVAGLIQYYEESDPRYRHAGIYLFLATDLHGRGSAARRSRCSPATCSKNGGTTAW